MYRADGLEATLEQARGESVEFPYLLANHVPMVMIAFTGSALDLYRIADWY